MVVIAGGNYNSGNSSNISNNNRNSGILLPIHGRLWSTVDLGLDPLKLTKAGGTLQTLQRLPGARAWCTIAFLKQGPLGAELNPLRVIICNFYYGWLTLLALRRLV